MKLLFLKPDVFINFSSLKSVCEREYVLDSWQHAMLKKMNKWRTLSL